MLILNSTSFEDGQEIPQKHGKKLENVSPQLSWTGAPEDTKSFALSVVDRHPIADGYVHWLVVDIDPGVTSLAEGAADGAMPAGSFEAMPYAGPFPPSGTHDYEFTLYALDTEHLESPKRISIDAFLQAAEPHILAKAQLVGKFTKIRG